MNVGLLSGIALSSISNRSSSCRRLGHTRIDSPAHHRVPPRARAGGIARSRGDLSFSGPLVRLQNGSFEAKGVAAMITVYVFGNAPAPVRNITRDLRALWALEESGLPYRLERLDFARGQLKGRDYARANPFGKIPAIDDDGFKLFESAAIVLYVAEKAGRLLPTEREERALASQWAFAAVNTVEPPIVELFTIDALFADQPWSRGRRPAVVEHVRQRLATLETEFAKRPYVLGDEFN